MSWTSKLLVATLMSLPLQTVWAGPEGDSAQLCNRLLDATMYDHFDAAQAEIARFNERHPQPTFVDRNREANDERPPVRGPRAFDAMLTQSTGFLGSPDPNSEHPVIAARMDAAEAGALRIVVPFKGKMITTFLYVYVPNMVHQPLRTGYLVNQPVSKVIYYMHGGGTPSAVAMNASTLAAEAARENKAVIAITQVGHGDATRNGITSMEDIADFNLAVIKMLVAPGVRRGIVGHSWGAQIALYMHQHSDEAKYKEIDFFGIASPPVDSTMGGSPRDRMAAAEELEKKIARRAQGLEPDPEGLLTRGCEGDLDFNANCSLHGKNNPVGTIFTAMTDFSYSMAIPSRERRAKLKPACSFMGANDTLCFVGNERPYLKYALRVFGSENVHILAGGKTWRGPTDKTGHQVFEDELILPDGTKVFEVYYKILRFMDKVTGADGPRPPPLLQAAKDLTPEQRKQMHAQAVRGALINTYLLYQNNFAFRSALNNSESFIRTETSREMEAKLITLKARKAELEKAVAQYRQLEAEGSEERLQVALSAFVQRMNQQYEIALRAGPSKANLHAGVQAAQLELALVRSPERRAVLADYVAKRKAVEDEFDATEINQRIGKAFQAYLDGQKGTKGMNIAEAKKMALRYFYLQLGEKERDLLLETWPTFGFKDELATAEWKAEFEQKMFKKTGGDSIEKATVGAAASMDQKIKEFWRQCKREVSEATEEKIKEIPLPTGVIESRTVFWELRIYEWSEAEWSARMARLQEYINIFPEELVKEMARLKLAVKTNLHNFKWPAGSDVSSLAQAEGQIALVKDIESDLYVPAEAEPEAKKSAEKIQRLKSLFEKMRVPEQLALATLAKLVKRRAEIVSELGRLVPFEENLRVKSKTEFLGGPATEAGRQFWDSFYWKDEALKNFSKLQQENLLKLHESGGIKEEDLRRISLEEKRAQEVYGAAKEQFLTAKATYRRMQLMAGLRGQVTSPDDPKGQRVKELLTELLGTSLLKSNASEIDPESLEGKIVAAREQARILMAERTQLGNSIQREQVRFTRLLPPDSRYYTSKAIRWSEVFDMTWEELEAWFNDGAEGDLRLKAFRDFLKNFERDWVTTIKLEHSNAKMPWYDVLSAGPGKRPILKTK